MDFTGTSANESFDGTAADEVIDGGGGDDTLGGQGGNDTISGGDGNDFVRGHAGDDSLAGGNGDDFINGGSGDDTIDGGAGINRASYGDAPNGVTVDLSKHGVAQDTGYGQDVLTNIQQVSATEFDDTLTGDGGDNWIWSAGGNDVVDAGAGNDLVQVGKGTVTAAGGAGVDTLGFYSATLDQPVKVSLALQGAAQATGDGSMTFSGFENLVGTFLGNDTLTGDANDNLLAGWSGSDSLVGGAGNDTLLGDGTVFPGGTAGAGPITVFDEDYTGPVGADTLDGGAGDDVMKGGQGDDLLMGGPGQDTLDGGTGTDVAVLSGARADYGVAAQGDGSVVVTDLRGGAPDGVDTLTHVEILQFSDGTLRLDPVVTSGTAGNDALVGGLVDDSLSGLGGDDTLGGQTGNDSLSGGDGNDFLRGQAGDDSLSAGNGDDYLSGGAGDDTLDGGAGTNRASYGDAPNGVVVDLTKQGQAQDTHHGQDVLTNIQQVSGTDFADTLTGDDRDNWIWSLGGNDAIDAGAGNDLVDVGKGTVTAVGGAGVDTLGFYSATLDHNANVSLALQGAPQDTGDGSMTLSGFENLVGTFLGNDTLTGDANDNLLAGWSGSDSLVGGAGNDTLLGDGTVFPGGTGGAGPITVVDEDYPGPVGADTLDGGAGADVLKGGQGDDRLIGGAGDDQLDGGLGSDTAVLSGARTDYTVAAQGDGSVVVTDLRGGSPDGTDTLTGVESLQFSDGAISVADVGATLSGTAGNDTLQGTSGADTYSGLGGDDTISGLSANDSLSGGDGNDILRGQDGDDSLDGGAADDFLVGGAGNDRIDGGTGGNRTSYGDATHGVTVDLTQQGHAQATGWGNDILVNIQNVTGSSYADTLTGDGGDNWLWGIRGADSIDAGAGDDVVTAGGASSIDNTVGVSSLVGGTGNDTLEFNVGTDPPPVNVSLALQNQVQATGIGNMSISGFENLAGTGNNDSLAGDAGANILAGGIGSDSLSGAAGNDTLLGDGIIRTPDGAAQWVNDYGVAGADTLDGGQGADSLIGGGGDDRLIGGAGDDQLDGGAGSDTAVFSGARTDYTVAAQGDGSVLVSDLRSGAPDGADRLTGVEFLQFADGTIAVDAVSAASGTPGNDTLTGGAGADSFAGLGGDDSLNGAAGNDSLSGGAGDDTVNGAAGDDTVDGGDGQDLLFVGTGADVIDGGAGQDRLSFSGGPVVNVDLSVTTAQVTGQGTKTIVNVEHVFGTTGGDTLAGDAQANWLLGNGGADSLSGRSGDDVLMVANGASTVDGGAGSDALVMSYATPGGVKISLAQQGVTQDTGQGVMKLTAIENLSGTVFGDTLTGDAGANLLAGEKGSDSLVGGAGDDTLLGDGEITVINGVIQTLTSPSSAAPTGAIGADTLDGGAGNDSLNAGDGDDLLIGGTGQDTLDGGLGVDTASFAASSAWVDVELPAGTVAVDGVVEDTITGVEAVIGSNNWDKIVGDGADNRIAAGAGHDFVQGGGGADTLLGEAGDDYLSGGAGDDILDGGAGLDRAAFSSNATAGVTVDLTIQGVAQDTGQGQDVLTGIEHLSGTRFSDKLTGDGGANWLWGGSDGSGITGNDTIAAGGGDDLVQVGAGDHNLDGGIGADTLSFQGNQTDITAAGVVASLGAQGTAQATNQGSMTFTNFENLSGSTYGDTLTGDAGANVLAGYGGADSLVGGAGNDTLLGDSFIHVDSHGVGTSGAITTFSDQGTGNDTLDGGAGDDLVKGEAGDDRLFSGTGNDTLDGGAGADTVTAQAGAGEVTRVTLGAGADKLVLDAASGGTVVASDFQTGASGDVIDLGAFLTAKLSGWNSADNPFVAGYLQLVQDGTATLLQINPDATGDDFATLVTFQNTSSLLFTAANLGFAPLPKVTGGASGDTFVLDSATFTPGTPGHSLQVDGGQGTDVVQVVAPTLVGASSTITPSADGASLLMDLDGDGVTDLTITNVEDIVVNGQKVVISGDLSGTGLAPNTIHYNGAATDDLLDAGGLTSLESVDAHGQAGNDTLIGAGDDDNLEGDDGDDKLVGGAGPDVLTGGAGNDTLDGGSGLSTDTAVFSGHHGDYTITDLGAGVLTIAGPDGADRLVDIERLQFDDGLFGQNHAPAGADHGAALGVGASKVFTIADFGFTDTDGDSLGAVKVASLPGSGSLTDNGVAVTAGHLVSAADIAAGHLVFAPAGAGTASFTFQVQDDGLVGWGANLDASANTFTVTTTAAPPPPSPPPPPPTPLGEQGTEGDDAVTLADGGARFLAGGGHDLVTGGSGGDFLQGNAGDDTLAGGLGDDTLAGGRDQDLLQGGAGDDWMSGDAGADTLDGGAGADTAFGGDGDDQIRGGDGDNYLRGGAGQDQISGGSGFDYINGNEGNDTGSGGLGDDWVLGGKDDDVLYGDEGNDILYGNMGADTLDGGAGADLFRGGQGEDILRGGDGDDWLSGDRGDDTVTGGAGADTFHTFDQAGIDRVTDFNAAQGDRVLVDVGTRYTLAQVGADTVIDMGAGGRMVLAGVQLNSLAAGWIVAG